MKKAATVFTALLAALGLLLAFLGGRYMSDKAQAERHAEAFDKYISRAIETAEQKGFGVDGAAEFAASNLWVAHELCDSPEISAELSNLWNELVYEKKFDGQEELLIAQLKDMLKR